MSSVATSWMVAHMTIRGQAVDRERAHPDLELEIRPIGRELPKKDQTRELVVRIGRQETVLNEQAIRALIGFAGGVNPAEEPHT